MVQKFIFPTECDSLSDTISELLPEEKEVMNLIMSGGGLMNPFENVFSIITTASAPRGITPPVEIIVAVPLATKFCGTTPQTKTILNTRVASIRTIIISTICRYVIFI